MSNIVYTTGYSGNSLAQLQHIAEELDATIFDIRFSPRSRNPQFSGKRMAQALSDRYQHTKALGNVNYKGGPILIVDYEAGKALIEESPRPVILMCVCRDASRCHRTTLAEQLLRDGFQVEELGPTQPSLLP